MTYYTRRQLIELLRVEEAFLVALEQEEIVLCDAPESEPDTYSERMLERVRVADNLVKELDVNLPGVAVIVQMREELAATVRSEMGAQAGNPAQDLGVVADRPERVRAERVDDPLGELGPDAAEGARGEVAHQARAVERRQDGEGREAELAAVLGVARPRSAQAHALPLGDLVPGSDRRHVAGRQEQLRIAVSPFGR